MEWVTQDELTTTIWGSSFIEPFCTLVIMVGTGGDNFKMWALTLGPWSEFYTTHTFMSVWGIIIYFNTKYYTYQLYHCWFPLWSYVVIMYFDTTTTCSFCLLGNNHFLEDICINSLLGCTFTTKRWALFRILHPQY